MTPAEQEQLADEIAMTERTVGRRRLLVALFGGSFAQHGDRVRRADRLARAATARRASAHVVERRRPARHGRRRADPAARRHVRPARDGVPRRPRRRRRLAGRAAADAARTLLTTRTIQGGALDGWVAYSKICTHAGCSVGLFGIDNREPDTLRQLVCPCHQSIFDPLDGARPVGGPATRSLPQLALDVDADGYLVARSDFTRPVGPLAWDEA